jgi:hypothetical protein
MGNLSKKYKKACGERALLMIRLLASEPFEYVAHSLVAARTTVVVNCSEYEKQALNMGIWHQTTSQTV